MSLFDFRPWNRYRDYDAYIRSSSWPFLRRIYIKRHVALKNMFWFDSFTEHIAFGTEPVVFEPEPLNLSNMLFSNRNLWTNLWTLVSFSNRNLWTLVTFSNRNLVTFSNRNRVVFEPEPLNRVVFEPESERKYVVFKPKTHIWCFRGRKYMYRFEPSIKSVFRTGTTET